MSSLQRQLLKARTEIASYKEIYTTLADGRKICVWAGRGDYPIAPLEAMNLSSLVYRQALHNTCIPSEQDIKRLEDLDRRNRQLNATWPVFPTTSHKSWWRRIFG